MGNWEFPQFRKYSNDKVFFKINSLEEFEELDLSIGSKHHIIKAAVHPDRVRIMDMLENNGGFWEPSSEQEWLHYLDLCKTSKL